MQNAPISENEETRLEAVKKLAILDTPAEERFDALTKLATILFDVTISTVTIMDAHREWYKSCQGMDKKEGDRAVSFCGHVIASEADAIIIEDTLKDLRFVDNPMVVGPPHIRFYAGIPIFSLAGDRVGVFCIKDSNPRKLSDADLFMLKTLASWAELEVNIESLKKILDGKESKDKLGLILSRITYRDVLSNLKSIKYALKVKIGRNNIEEFRNYDNLVSNVMDFVLKLQTIT